MLILLQTLPSSLLHTQRALTIPPPLAGSSPSLPLFCQPFLSPPSPPPSNYFISSSSCCQGISTHLTPLINANVKESHHKGLKLIKTHIPLIPPDFPLFHAVTSYTLCACINSGSLHHIIPNCMGFYFSPEHLQSVQCSRLWLCIRKTPVGVI